MQGKQILKNLVGLRFMKNKPIALTIAGSDSGGGAGIQADLKTFMANGVFGTSAITCITAQNPDGVTGIMEITPEIIAKQIQAVLDFFPVSGVKTGMLFSREIIDVVVRFSKKRLFKLVVDPVMIATSGARLLKDDANLKMKEELIPLSDIFTPNLDEAGFLLEKKITVKEEMEDAAVSLYNKYRAPVLLKGGHLKGEEALDIFYDGKEIFRISSPFIKNVSTHGTGCTYSSAICAGLAKGMEIKDAIKSAKFYLSKTIEDSFLTGKVSSLNHGN